MKKEELRKLYIQKRKALTVSEQMKADDLLLIQFQRLKIDIPSLIMTYAPLIKMHEFDPEPITDYCYFKNPEQLLFYPVVHPTTLVMQSVLVHNDTEFELNKFGIPEPVNSTPMLPEEIDMVILPLLAYSVKGHRVGYGKGYYDHYLKKCRSDVIKIGFSYFDPEPIIHDTNRYDVKLDYCISPERIYSF